MNKTISINWHLLALVFTFLANVNSVQADGGCEESDYVKESNLFKTRLAAVAKESEEALIIHQERLRSGCIKKNETDESASAIKRINLSFAKKSESSENFFSINRNAPSAFTYYKNADDSKNANRMGMLALKKNPDDIQLLKAVLNAAESYENESQQVSFAEVKETIAKLAQQNGERLIKEEASLAKALDGNDMGKLGTTVPQSLGLLEQAADFFKMTKSGDTKTKAIAEKRGDDLSKNTKSTILLGMASSYYKYAGSKKSVKLEAELVGQQKDLENTGKEMQKAFKEKSADDAKKFKKGADDLEDELGI